MRAQVLYDLREETDFCSGNELGAFLWRTIRNNSGNANVPDVDAQTFIRERMAYMKELSPSAYAEIVTIKPSMAV